MDQNQINQITMQNQQAHQRHVEASLRHADQYATDAHRPHMNAGHQSARWTSPRAAALAVFLSAFSVIAVMILATAPAHASVYNTAIKNHTTGKCIDLPGFGAPGLQPVTQYDCRPGTGDNQMFDLVNGVDGFLIRSVKSPGLCLDFPNFGAPTSADKVSLYYCQNTTADNQLWKSEWNDARTAFQLISAKTYYSGQRMCLDVDGFAWAVNDLRLGAYPCSGSLGDDHWWKFL